MAVVVIDGRFRRRPGFFSPFVRVELQLPRLRLEPAVLEFLIDTGADRASLHPVDAVAGFGFEPGELRDSARWGEIAVLQGIGGDASCYVEDAVFGFRHTDGRLQEIRSSIYVMQPSNSIFGVPSILGWNVLRHFDLRMSWYRQTVTLLDPAEASAL